MTKWEIVWMVFGAFTWGLYIGSRVGSWVTEKAMVKKAREWAERGER